MFVNCSPSVYNESETKNSLDYAQRVKKIKNNVNKNLESKETAKMRATIEMLSSQMDQMKELLEKSDMDTEWKDLEAAFEKAMDEQGITARIFAEYGSTSQECPNYNGLPLGFDSCIAAFVVFGVGISIAAVGFIIEIIIPKSMVNLMPNIGGLRRMNEEGEPVGLSVDDKNWATKFPHE